MILLDSCDSCWKIGDLHRTYEELLVAGGNVVQRPARAESAKNAPRFPTERRRGQASQGTEARAE